MRWGVYAHFEHNNSRGKSVFEREGSGSWEDSRKWFVTFWEKHDKFRPH